MIKLYTDTSANLPTSIIKYYGIKILPFSYTINGAQHIPTEDTEFRGKDFYDSMRQGAEIKTSMISLGLIESKFREALENGDDVLYIGMSGGISGTASAAAIVCKQLKEEFPERKIAAVDTLAASLGEGLQVINTAKRLREGASFDEALQAAESEKEYMCQYFTVDDLSYLQRGGRISKTVAVVGTVFNIKPLLTGNSEGKIVMCGKERGRLKAFSAITEKYKQKVRDLAEDIGIAHADDLNGAQKLKEMLKKAGFCGHCLTVDFEPVTGSHVGPGTVALFFLGTEK